MMGALPAKIAKTGKEVLSMRKIRAMRNRKGFTLIELLIVVAILAILIALIAPRVITSLNDAQDSTATAIRKSIANALERYAFDHNGSYPDSISQLAPKYISKKDLEDAQKKFEITYKNEQDTETGDPYTLKVKPK